MLKKKIKRYISALVIALFVTSIKVFPVNAQAMTNAYSVTNVSTYKMSNTYTFTNTGTTTATNVKFSVVVGSQYDESPYTEFLTDYKADLGTIVKNSDGTQTLNASIGTLLPGQSKTVTVTRNFETGAIDYGIDSAKVKDDYSSFADYAKYTSPAARIESTNSTIKAKADIVIAGETNPYLKAQKIFNFVNTYINYDYSGVQANKGALNALQTRLGVCEDFADLFVAMCRAEGVPARTVYGYRNLSDVAVNQTVSVYNDAHSWAEFYLPDYGWVIAEPTTILTNNGVRVPATNYFAKNITPYEHILNEYGSGSTSTISYNGSTKVTAVADHKITKMQNGQSYTVTPYDNFNNRINDTEKLVEAAETSKLQSDVDKAKSLISTIDDIDIRSGFEQRINAIVVSTPTNTSTGSTTGNTTSTAPIIKSIPGGTEIIGKVDAVATSYNNYSVTIGGVTYKISNTALVMNSLNTKQYKFITSGIDMITVGSNADIRVYGGKVAIASVPFTAPISTGTTNPSGDTSSATVIKKIPGGQEVIGKVDAATTSYNNYSVTIGGVTYKISNTALVMNSLNTKQYVTIYAGVNKLKVGGNADIRVYGGRVAIVTVPFN